VSFGVLAGNPLTSSKRTWNGIHQRMSVLAAAGIRLPDRLGPAGSLAGVDDVLDAAVAAWTARRVVRGQAISFPSPPAEATIWA
jgi:predicted RNase H-like nuclease